MPVDKKDWGPLIYSLVCLNFFFNRVCLVCKIQVHKCGPQHLMSLTPLPYTVSPLPHGVLLRSLSLFCKKHFFKKPGWFLFLSITNIIKLECLHRAASYAISSCPSSSSIPLYLSEASLPPFQVTLTHFALSSYKTALHAPTLFSISGFARLGVKLRLQILVESFCIHSPAHAFFYFP